MSFEKVRLKKASAIVAEQMVGSRLSEREALSALTAVGLIESRPGSGNHVRNGTVLIDSVGKEAVFVLESEASCLEIMEARGLFEPPVAGLAAQKRTQEDIKNLQATYKKLRQLAKKGDFDPYFDANKEFHLAIVHSTRNSLVFNVLTPLVNTMDQHLYREFTHDYYFKNQLGLEEVAGLHDDILEAIVAGDSALAARKMREHWDRMREAVSAH